VGTGPGRDTDRFAHRIGDGLSLRNPSRALIALALITLTLRHPACADVQGPDGSTFSFNGFGTAGVVHSNEDKADFTASDFEPTGASYSRSWSASVDSLIGGQLSATFTPQFSAVLQLIAQQNYNDTYWPHMEWANIKYLFTPDLSVRVGRIVMPTFLDSDSREVGYSNPWVRPPTEVYSANPITNLDGLDASYRLHLGRVTNTLQATYGRNLSFRFAGGSKFDARYAWGIFDDAEYGAALVRVGYLSSDITLNDGTALFDAFGKFGSQGAAITNQYDIVDKSTSILTLAASYDPGQWFVMGEWATSRSESFLGASTGWYVSGGRRVGQFTPYLTYAQITQRSNSSPGLNLAALPANLVPAATALNADLNEVLNSRPDQYTWSIGMRWDFMKNFDLKLQLDRINLGAGSAGTLINVQPGFEPGSTVFLISSVVDFVF
jgi:hypothetical protein